MNKRQFIVITEVIMSFFPDFEKKISTDTRLKIWYEMFEDLDFNSTQAALKKVLIDSKFMPTVSEIRQAVAEIENPATSITGAEAWGQVKKAIGRYGMYNPEEAFESMDQEVARLVRRFGWKDICMSDKIGVERSNFMKLWEEQQKKDKHYAALPGSVKMQIENNKAKKLQNTVKQLSEKFSSN